MKGKGTIKRAILALICCLILTFASMGLAACVESGFGTVDVTKGFIETPEGQVAYKLYKPFAATAESPAPAVLAMHGYQNDKETNDAYSIELSRRGIVVLSIDSFGHGATIPSLRARGWPNSADSGNGVYKVLTNLAMLDFFNEELSGGIGDTSMGGNTGYDFLASLPYVDAERIGITGHSLGTYTAWSVAAARPEHNSVVLQCVELFPEGWFDANKITFNNVLSIHAKYDEFGSAEKRGLTPEGSLAYSDFMGQDSAIEWNRTYGSFSDGSARRIEVLNTNHRLTTHDSLGLAVSIDWFTSSLGVGTELLSSEQSFIAKELLVLLGTLAALASLMPAFLLLTHIPFFSVIAGEPTKNPERYMSRKERRRAVLITILISAATYPFITQIGHVVFPYPIELFRMPIGNAFTFWFIVLATISFLMLRSWYKKCACQESGANLCDLGLAKADKPSSISWGLACKSLLAASILVGFLYLLVSLSVFFTGLDFRFIWPLFKPFTLERLGQFLIYLPFYIAFFLINGGVKLYGQLRLRERKSGLATQLAWWGNSVIIMLGGIFIIALIEYIPFFLGLGAGIDLLFSSLFGGPFMSILSLMLPQFIIFYFFSTWFFRKSGNVFIGSITIAMLAAWAATGGSAIY